MARRSLGAAVLLLPLCSSCFTTALWGGSIDEEGSANFEDREERSALTLVLLTPFTVLLDLCTAPIQAWFHGDEDDDDC